MSERLSESQMLKLAEIYKQKECLWRMEHPDYKTRDIRTQSYHEMSVLLDIPFVGPTDISKKIKNLRSSYYQELNRIREDSNYVPKVAWFATVDSYLRPYVCTRREGGNPFLNLTPNLHHSSQTNHTVAAPPPAEENGDDSMGQESIQDYKEEEPEERPRTRNETKMKLKLQRYRKFRSKNRHSEYNHNSHKPEKSKEDEFDIFGKYIAVTLRGMPPELSIVARTQLQETLSKVQLKNLPGLSFLETPISKTPELPTDIGVVNPVSVKFETEDPLSE